MRAVPIAAPVADPDDVGLRAMLAASEARLAEVEQASEQTAMRAVPIAAPVWDPDDVELRAQLAAMEARLAEAEEASEQGATRAVLRHREELQERDMQCGSTYSIDASLQQQKQHTSEK